MLKNKKLIKILEREIKRIIKVVVQQVAYLTKTDLVKSDLRRPITM
jgi:hypothetical protein